MDAMIPDHLKADYWNEVQRSLEQDHGYDSDDAKSAVKEFHSQALHKTGEMVYHAEPDETAVTVKNWFESLPSSHSVRSA